MSNTARMARLLEHERKRIEDERWNPPRVSMPVDVTDEDQFPNIAEAIRWARENGK